MLDMTLIGIVEVVRFIGGMIMTVVLGYMFIMFYKENKNLIKHAFTFKAISLALLLYFILVMIIGSAPSNFS